MHALLVTGQRFRIKQNWRWHKTGPEIEPRVLSMQCIMVCTVQLNKCFALCFKQKPGKQNITTGNVKIFNTVHIKYRIQLHCAFKGLFPIIRDVRNITHMWRFNRQYCYSILSVYDLASISSNTKQRYHRTARWDTQITNYSNAFTWLKARIAVVWKGEMYSAQWERMQYYLLFHCKMLFLTFFMQGTMEHMEIYTL